MINRRLPHVTTGPPSHVPTGHTPNGGCRTSAVEIPADGDTPATHLFIADQVQLDGTAVGRCCPRAALKDALKNLEEMAGLRVVASFEHEFVIDGLPAAPAFSFARLRSAEPFGSDLIQLLTEVGLEPENWLPEYGDGQYEIILAPTGALAAADRAVLLKEIIRDLARRRGLEVTFAPVLAMDGTGNGVHIHLSLTDLDGPPRGSRSHSWSRRACLVAPRPAASPGPLTEKWIHGVE